MHKQLWNSFATQSKESIYSEAMKTGPSPNTNWFVPIVLSDDPKLPMVDAMGDLVVPSYEALLLDFDQRATMKYKKRRDLEFVKNIGASTKEMYPIGVYGVEFYLKLRKYMIECALNLEVSQRSLRT